MYEGPGLYQHYKGGYYQVLGIGQDEASDRRYVVYISLSSEHQLSRNGEDVTFVLRPQSEHDVIFPHIDRPFDEPTMINGEQVERFMKV
jgi:hypothetical protein